MFGGRGITPAVRNLIIANGAVFVLQWIVGPRMTLLFGLVPHLAWSRFYLWQFVTYLFLHGGVLHLAVNMYTLYAFGCDVERMWGSRAFYRYYFITGCGAGLFHTLITPFSNIPTIGASGAVLGVLTAFAVMFPEREITLLLFFILPVRMRARILALIFAGISILSGVMGSADGVAHFAHLGGMAIGYLYLNRNCKTFRKAFDALRRKSRLHVSPQKKEDREELRKRVDEVLDKANEVGLENLNAEEKRILKRACRVLKKEKEGPAA